MTKGDTALEQRTTALFEVIVDVLALYFRLRAIGSRAGLMTSWGGGVWGFLRSLKLHGPLTVPQLARMRPVARQHIQKLANEAADEGLIEFVHNPAHRRSRLLRLTDEGEALYNEMTGSALNSIRAWAGDFSLDEIATSHAVLEALGERVARDLETPAEEMKL